MRLSRRPEPFDSEEYIYEPKIDGFRSLAYVENGQCDLVSRNGNTFRNFKHLAEWISENLRVESAVLDGEIASVDDSGRSVFTLAGGRENHNQRDQDDQRLKPMFHSVLSLSTEFVLPLNADSKVGLAVRFAFQPFLSLTIDHRQTAQVQYHLI
jgi:ATP-dependent DNA ligase